MNLAINSAALVAAPAIALSPVSALEAPEPDPIWEAIEEYRASAATSAAAEADYAAREKRVLSELGKMHPSIAVGALRFPGPMPPSLPELVYSVERLDQLVPPDEFPVINTRYRADLEAQIREHDAIVGDSEEVAAAAYGAAQDALHNALTVIPTTMAGILALLEFARSEREAVGAMFEDHMMLDALETVSEALRDLTAAA